VDARSAREWSSEAAARAICPNSLRQSFEDSNLASIVERYVLCMQCPMCLTESAAPSGSSRGCSLSMIFESRNLKKKQLLTSVCYNITAKIM